MTRPWTILAARLARAAVVAAPAALGACNSHDDQAGARTVTAKMQRGSVAIADQPALPARAVLVARPPPLSRDLLVRSIVRSGGSASPEDVIVVSHELAPLPLPLLHRLHAKNMGLIVCRGSVVDAMPELAPLTPRGWSPGSSFRDIPGTYSPETRSVLIAVNAEGSVPARGQGHDSYNLVLHELAHGLQREHVLDDVLLPAALAAAFDSDLVRQRETFFDMPLVLPDVAYMQNPADVTREEVFAETFARFWGGDPRLPIDFPETYAMWAHAAATLAAMI